MFVDCHGIFFRCNLCMFNMCYDKINCCNLLSFESFDFNLAFEQRCIAQCPPKSTTYSFLSLKVDP